MIYPVWRQQLVRSLHLHRSKPEAKYFQVASVGNKNLPKVRTMVCRGFQDINNKLLAVTDIRSKKITDWQTHPKTEILWYFAKSREQYRLSCNVTVIHQNAFGNLVFFGDLVDENPSINSLYHAQWNALSQSAQFGFYGPEPNSSLDTAPQSFSQTETQQPLSELSSIDKTEQAHNKNASISQH